MTRNYANISTAIWRNEGFRNLSRQAQHMYLLLTSQPDISAAGVLSLNAKRWSTRTHGATTAEVVEALNELQEHRFIAFDTDTEELLVRSFVRWDGGYGNIKRRPVILRAASEVESELLRQWLAGEFRRLDLPTDGLAVGDRDGDSLSGPEGAASCDDIDDGLFPQENRLSGAASPPDGVVVTKALVVDPPTHNPHTPAQAPAAAKPRPENGTRLREDWDQTEECRRGREWASKDYPNVNLDEEVRKFMNHWLSKPGKNATKRDWYRTFQNWIMEANRRLSRYGQTNGQGGRFANGMNREPSAGAKAIPVGERCERHPRFPASTCGPCRSEGLISRKADSAA
ncbi:hypothetical protein AMIS_21080 [Actinoplanes missouriensis 431]|uniref:Uncharacterized protein n=1 Tax=Actinoplanes missouriensis (strain ATCC 14538 / DSM 43046 / CBS 188.64 / JCM 3121 / NBRC 102363 / NCIMB 12654 / NRRL B-3342 / UNCC 431) TaxID=512565 RepID=I0H2U1_ACTM4|nr:hypothetical protein [Actinoplanes missouriensis]BAL87328.1 hypothetical protein AMIS_21080 [Actinoplanes missouriensis 431]